MHQGRGRVADSRNCLLNGLMREKITDVSAEVYFAVSAALSVIIALVAAQFRITAFGSFTKMAAVLIAADLLIYVLIRVRLLKAPRSRIG